MKGRNSEEQEPNESLDALCVIDTLEVGPVKLETHRLTAPYTIRVNGKEHTTELVYKYAEPVFAPEETESMNLAGMIAAQVALNYGLFCKEIIFHGFFDGQDRRFIKEMAKNTAREIYVKKFLEPNSFLCGTAAALPADKQKSYLRAQLLYIEKPGDGTTQVKSRLTHWDTEGNRTCVLSSGGKDSLLSYGLLNEIGRETHPVFINESGRHWFTALNAFRHFESHVPNTARVWTNSDRLFAWMLRHLPFIRPDFADHRSDEYPIRLWTVAVFLFGTLPLLRKRKIRNLVIGDEYDSTRKYVFKGITHYDGLYDQSQYFDHALTRYFHNKGWGINQFSIVRPLSELLIEKILVNRYPDLQRFQVSCHATHKEGEKVHPCGRCEKCRRIVGMLTALDADPERCGYTKEQIAHCLNSLTEKGINQEAEDAQHLAYLLAGKGLLDASKLKAGRASCREEVVKLRFDPDKSPFEAIPKDLRSSLYQIFMQYAEGAVRRQGRTWIDIDPLKDPAFEMPYPFEIRERKKQMRDVEEGEFSYTLGSFTWPEAEKRFREVDIALLPVGAIEQHGPHLPLDTDAFDADYLAKEVARACSMPKPIVFPLISYGVSYHHQDFSGTISISPETLSKMVYEIGIEAAKQGITKLVIINGHGGNGPALHFAAQMINRDARIFTCVDSGESSDTDVNAIAATHNDVHAGEIETSTTLAVRPELVRADRHEKFVPDFSIRYLNFSSKRSVGWYAYTSKISQNGVMGDPTLATPEKGREMWAQMIKHLVEFVEDLKNMSLDEIHQKRY
ncbi:MAG: creatininase family protein [Planctomycetota bacterium]